MPLLLVFDAQQVRGPHLALACDLLLESIEACVGLAWQAAGPAAAGRGGGFGGLEVEPERADDDDEEGSGSGSNSHRLARRRRARPPRPRHRHRPGLRRPRAARRHRNRRGGRGPRRPRAGPCADEIRGEARGRRRGSAVEERVSAAVFLQSASGAGASRRKTRKRRKKAPNLKGPFLLSLPPRP